MTDAPRLLLLDRDGVLLQHVEPYILRSSDVAVLPGAIAAVAAMGDRGAAVAVVTNQSPIGRGLIESAFVDEVNAWLAQQLAAAGVRSVTFHVCPHDPDQGCRCRKPLPGLLLDAMADAGVTREGTWMVGDHDTDLVAAVRAGCTEAVHVLTGRQKTPSPHATRIVERLSDLVSIIDEGSMAPLLSAEARQ